LKILQLPPNGKKNFKRKLVDRYKRSLFNNKKSSGQIKSELMKLIKNSNEIIDNEMIGLKSFHYCFNSSYGENKKNERQENQSSSSNNSYINLILPTEQNSDLYSYDVEMILNQNSITYEQLQAIIDDLLHENNYQNEESKIIN
jgi:hypothetical protein